jgi:hypothetical protein
MNFTIYIVVVVGGNNGSLVEMVFFVDVAKILDQGTGCHFGGRAYGHLIYYASKDLRLGWKEVCC